MKLPVVLLLVLIFGSAKAQFHVKVACNPENGGKVDPTWETNYTVFYTLDNWKHSLRISDIEVSYLFGDETQKPVSYLFEPFTFKHMESALAYAKRFKSAQYVGRYEAFVYQDFLNRVDKLKKEQSIPHPIKKSPETECQTKIIY